MFFPAENKHFQPLKLIQQRGAGLEKCTALHRRIASKTAAGASARRWPPAPKTLVPGQGREHSRDTAGTWQGHGRDTARTRRDTERHARDAAARPHPNDATDPVEHVPKATVPRAAEGAGGRAAAALTGSHYQYSLANSPSQFQRLSKRCVGWEFLHHYKRLL